ncbi:proteasome assembly chaperone family protein [Acidianus sulfidivorans JP7]|uniref:Carboxylate--amine ligase n=1 Tax=Acidianus sulfidivorans JP7 TaxID=619593 RepID=A0A2U9IMJ2_9CREN|nr:PAC2 family protein [Acidianus sulfidivorans]AWR97248.1 proteasome assembly chaperone family protein [Acidianus sulfidivorans JP7]
MELILKDIKEDKLKGATFITGFRTIGEVGYLASRYIVLKRKMKRIGFIATKNLRDVTFLDDYGIATPLDLFYDEEYNTIVLLNHLVPVQKDWNELARDTIKWLKKINIKNILLIGGLDKRYRQKEERLRWLKTSKSNIDLEYPLLEKQLIMVGPLALFTIYSEMQDLPANVLLPYADKDRIDPAAAAVAVEVINKIIGFNVDPSELYEDAKKLEEELQKQLESIQKEMNKAGLDRHYM